MTDVTYSPNQAIRVALDQQILHDLIHGDTSEAELRDDKARKAYERLCALREHQVYLLMRDLVSQFNTRMKGRRDRFKLVEEGEGLTLEWGNS